MYLLPLALAVLATSITSTLAAPRPLIAPMPHNYIADRRSSSAELLKRETGGVRLCTGPNFTGSCDYVVWPVNVCIALNDYAGHTLSFQPDAGNECFLMQDRCNSNMLYADLTSSSPEDSDLSGLPWIEQSESYLCLTPLDV
ncbi:hypothetical protein LTR53_008172 [Teratosphaeriaceae sp. CCFEE 6253]|nr:hypothetical protein LTR53_008172 [Teratosphaeriaceae sp. CCFEE 6253]